MSTRGKDTLKILCAAGESAKDILDNPMYILESYSKENNIDLLITDDKPVNLDDVMYGCAMHLIKWMIGELTKIQLDTIE